MKYLKLSLTFILFINSVWAYKPNAISYNENEFHSYLIPHSSQLVGDYYELVHIVLPEFNNAKNIFSSIMKIQKNLLKLNQCKKDCREIIVEMKEANSNIQNEIKKIKKVENQQVFEDFKTQAFLTSMFTSVIFENSILKKKTDLLLLEPYFTQLYLKFNFFLFSLLPKHLKIFFEEYWSFFIKKLYENVMINPQLQFYKININDLNFQFNEFNLKMGKRNAANSQEAKSKMNQMTNQWNVILKIILRL